jgi:hypothetical protein
MHLVNDERNRMMEILRNMFAASPTPAMAQAVVEYQRELIFKGYQLKDETLTIDVETAGLQEFEDALEDCHVCICTEYPETENGYYRALKIDSDCRAAIIRRFAKHGPSIMKTIQARLRW